jgi:hypothetical protein
MGLIGKILTGGALVGAGMLIGSNIAKDKEYVVQRSQDRAMIVDKVTKNEYVLTRAENQTYLGTAAHNFKGAFILGAQEISAKHTTPDELQKEFMDIYQGGN